MIDATCKAKDWHRALPWWEMGLASCVRWHDDDWQWGFRTRPSSNGLVRYPWQWSGNEWLVRDGDPLVAPTTRTRTPDKGQGRE